jgi:hypothetical protein
MCGKGIDDMQEAVDLIYPVVEVVLRFRSVALLNASSREAVWTVERAGDVYEGKLKHENGDDPPVDTRGGRYVRIRKHTLNVFGVDFDHKVAKADEI